VDCAFVKSCELELGSDCLFRRLFRDDAVSVGYWPGLSDRFRNELFDSPNDSRSIFANFDCRFARLSCSSRAERMRASLDMVCGGLVLFVLFRQLFLGDDRGKQSSAAAVVDRLSPNARRNLHMIAARD
jgi:hypothetical protein